jgi:sensor c-di-GMP phosphodiesterase-like protein
MMMPMKQAMQNLLYVEKALRNGTYKAEAPILTVLLEEIKNTSFQFEVPCSSDTNIEHLKTYENLALKYKAKMLVDIRKLQHEINKNFGMNCSQKDIEEIASIVDKDIKLYKLEMTNHEFFHLDTVDLL